MLIVRLPAAADASYSCDVSSSREDKRPLTWLRGPEDSHHSGPPCGANWKGTIEHYLQKPELPPYFPYLKVIHNYYSLILYERVNFTEEGGENREGGRGGRREIEGEGGEEEEEEFLEI